MRTQCCLVLLLFCAAGGYGQSKSPEEQIRELEQQRAAAVVHKDVNFLDKITAADSVRISARGDLETKSELLSQLKSGELTYRTIKVDQLSVTVFDQFTAVTGRSFFEGTGQGKPFKGSARFSRVWVRSGSGWQEKLFQLTPIVTH